MIAPTDPWEEDLYNNVHAGLYDRMMGWHLIQDVFSVYLTYNFRKVSDMKDCLFDWMLNHPSTRLEAWEDAPPTTWNFVAYVATPTGWLKGEHPDLGLIYVKDFERASRIYSYELLLYYMKKVKLRYEYYYIGEVP